ncbi:glutathione S-transferase U19-like [Salvia miltiorrhiza]|uniref:glutathione S-transferase U19-like n=1 Tax=Salvia miltiorrhiza TaxID=226208 RepID=UPI0025AC41D2|nr:glutathione S-transferase U19-like [Salvia miltiorrhiza]
MSLKLLDFWGSPFAVRVRLALAEKGLSYESQEEDLFGGKSELLLKSNPIYEKVPVLLHDAKPVLESANIVYYIDETWPKPQLLPACSYARSRARFWTDFIDKNVFDVGRKIWMGKGAEVEAGKDEFMQVLKKLEGALGEREYYGGEEFGFVDVMLVSLSCWFPTYEKYGGFKVAEESPKIAAWIKKCYERETVAKSMPDPHRVIELVGMLRKMHGVD